MEHFLEFSSRIFELLDLTEKQLKWVQIGVALIVGLSGGITGYLYARWRNRRNFTARVFLDQIVLGVNFLDWSPDNTFCTLRLRTFLEDNLTAVLDNSILQERVVAAAKAATERNMVITLADPRDHELLMTKIQNAVSQRYGPVFMAQMLGKKVDTRPVHFVVTCEKYGGIRATKIRVLFFTLSDLEDFSDPDSLSAIRTEKPYHFDRVKTLHHIAIRLGRGSLVCGTVGIPVDAL